MCPAVFFSGMNFSLRTMKENMTPNETKVLDTLI